MLALSIYIALVVVLIGIRNYQESKWLKCLNIIKLTGKVAIITGANSGIGYEIAKDFVKRRAKVILACRSMDSAQQAIQKIKETYPEGLLIPMELDLASLRSIAVFTKNICKNYDQIDLLINNAGVSYPSTDRQKTKDGFEIHMGVNYLGHFYLTKGLLPLLSKSEGSRIIIVTSKLHEKGFINPDDLNCEKATTKVNLYANSKLADAYFCRELAKRTNVNVYSCCPGWVYTNLFRHHYMPFYYYPFVLPVAFLFLRSSVQGAQTPIYCATEPDLSKESGYMYRNCKRYNSKIKFDDKISEQLWEKSEELINNKLKEYSLIVQS